MWRFSRLESTKAARHCAGFTEGLSQQDAVDWSGRIKLNDSFV